MINIWIGSHRAVERRWVNEGIFRFVRGCGERLFARCAQTRAQCAYSIVRMSAEGTELFPEVCSEDFLKFQFGGNLDPFDYI